MAELLVYLIAFAVAFGIGAWIEQALRPRPEVPAGEDWDAEGEGRTWLH